MSLETRQGDSTTKSMCFSKTFLGVTLACARCHDHKFDAILTKDYYALAGMLKSSRRQESILDPRRPEIGKASDELTALRGQGDAAIRSCVQKFSLAASRPVLAILACGTRGHAWRVQVRSRRAIAATCSLRTLKLATMANGKLTERHSETSPQTQETTPKYQGQLGAKGRRWVNSHNVRDGSDVRGGDQHVGTLTSPEFTIQHRSIRFLVGGGAHQGKTCVNLLVDGKAVRTQTGRSSNQMFQAAFDVAEFERTCSENPSGRSRARRMGQHWHRPNSVSRTTAKQVPRRRRPVKDVADEINLDVKNSRPLGVPLSATRKPSSRSHPMRVLDWN